MSSETLEIGLRRYPRVAGPSAHIVAALAQCDTTDLADAMNGSQWLSAAIRPLFRAPRVAGPAVTVAVPSGSQEARRVAMDMAGPGDVLVVAARGTSLFACLGGKLAQRLKNQGVAAVVIDGSVRDKEEIAALGLPVFCRGETVAAAPKIGPGEVNVPVACGDVVINPGDIVVGDSNGVVIVPQAAAEAVLARLKAVERGWSPY